MGFVSWVKNKDHFWTLIGLLTFFSSLNELPLLTSEFEFGIGIILGNFFLALVLFSFLYWVYYLIKVKPAKS